MLKLARLDPAHVVELKRWYFAVCIKNLDYIFLKDVHIRGGIVWTAF